MFIPGAVQGVRSFLVLGGCKECSYLPLLAPICLILGKVTES